MKRVCAWCGVCLSGRLEDEDERKTHTICDSCAEMIREEMKTLATTVDNPHTNEDEARDIEAEHARC